MLDRRALDEARLWGWQVGLRRVGTKGFGECVPVTPYGDHDGVLVWPFIAASNIQRDEAGMGLDSRQAVVTNEFVEFSTAIGSDADVQDPDDHAIFGAP